MTINRNRSNNRDAILSIEFKRLATKLDRERQYLVTLKMRRRRTHRNTLTPSGGITCVLVRTISPILPITTKQSNRLKSDTK